MPMGRPPKYEPLRQYLVAQPGDAVRLTFAEIETILGAPLPVWAYSAGFWANHRERWSMSPQARSWHTAGWRVGMVAPPTITFVRMEGGA